jgi:uncharacterized protein (TIGR02145 family)
MNTFITNILNYKMKRTIIILITLLLGIYANAQTWNCGYPTAADVTATLSNDTLYVRGTGQIRGYSSDNSTNPPTPTTPWYINQSQIKHVVIEEGITKIGSFAFGRCEALISVNIPSSITAIDAFAFYYCGNLTSPIIIPNGVKIIEATTFMNCSKIPSVIIPESVTVIYQQAFRGCSSLNSLIIPSNVKQIEFQAFQGCSNLSSVTNLNPVPQTIVASTFSGVNLDSCTLTVPCGSLSAYQDAAFWQDFGILEEEDCPKPGISHVKANFSCPGQVTVTYNLDTTNPTDVTLYYSPDGGKTWLIAQTVSGDLTAQTSGKGKTIVWDNRADHVRWGNFKLKVDVPKPPEPECVMINGVCWATRNVGEPGTFTDKPEDTGMYYQWNRKVGWSTNDPMKDSNGGTVWNSSIPAGTAWEKDNDPSPPGWRVPTREEIQKLSDTDKVTNVWANENNVNGRRFTDKTTGNSIFLPAAGGRGNNDGQLGNVGISVNYWSDTPSDSINAYLLNFTSSMLQVAGGYRRGGYSIRPVK